VIQGCYVKGNDPGSVEKGSKLFLASTEEPTERKNITLGLDSDSVDRKNISVYRSVLEGGNNETSYGWDNSAAEWETLS
jgi:hypothetical protein